MTSLGKLVRDLIPDLIRADGGTPRIRVLDDEEYRSALLNKLVEEAQEARDATSADLPGELGDLIEVLLAVAAQHGLSWQDIERAAQAKRAARGAFDQRLWLD